MSLSLCIDTQDWLGAGCVSIGDTGSGVLGSAIAATGDAGAGYAFDDLESADLSKEICGRITTWPASGTLYAYEDTSFSYARTGDGVDSFQYQLYVDAVAIGTPQTVTLTVGAAAGTAPGANLSGAAVIAGGAATGQQNGASAGILLTGAGSIQAGAASAPGSLNGSALGAMITGSASITAGPANNGAFARAPSGDGYRPRSQSRQSRPADLQGYKV